MSFYTKKDWELEKDSILCQSKEYLRYIQDLNMKHEQERLRFEQEKKTLLHELNKKNEFIQKLQQQHQLEIQVILYSSAEKEVVRRNLGFHNAAKPNSPPISPTDMGFSPLDALSNIKKLEEESCSAITQKQTDHGQHSMLPKDVVEILMRAEARLDNLLIDHEQNIRDLQETHQLEQGRLTRQHRIEMEKRELDNKTKLDTLKKERNQIKQNYSSLKKEHRLAVQLGKELTSITAVDDERYSNGNDGTSNLVNLLRIALGNVARHHPSDHLSSDTGSSCMTPFCY